MNPPTTSVKCAIPTAKQTAKIEVSGNVRSVSCASAMTRERSGGSDECGDSGCVGETGGEVGSPRMGSADVLRGRADGGRRTLKRSVFNSKAFLASFTISTAD